MSKADMKHVGEAPRKPPPPRGVVECEGFINEYELVAPPRDFAHLTGITDPEAAAGFHQAHFYRATFTVLPIAELKKPTFKQQKKGRGAFGEDENPIPSVRTVGCGKSRVKLKRGDVIGSHASTLIRQAGEDAQKRMNIVSALDPSDASMRAFSFARENESAAPLNLVTIKCNKNRKTAEYWGFFPSPSKFVLYRFLAVNRYVARITDIRRIEIPAGEFTEGFATTARMYYAPTEYFNLFKYFPEGVSPELARRLPDLKRLTTILSTEPSFLCFNKVAEGVGLLGAEGCALAEEKLSVPAKKAGPALESAVKAHREACSWLFRSGRSSVPFADIAPATLQFLEAQHAVLEVELNGGPERRLTAVGCLFKKCVDLVCKGRAASGGHEHGYRLRRAAEGCRDRAARECLEWCCDRDMAVAVVLVSHAAEQELAALKGALNGNAGVLKPCQWPYDRRMMTLMGARRSARSCYDTLAILDAHLAAPSAIVQMLDMCSAAAEKILFVLDRESPLTDAMRFLGLEEDPDGGVRAPGECESGDESGDRGESGDESSGSGSGSDGSESEDTSSESGGESESELDGRRVAVDRKRSLRRPADSSAEDAPPAKRQRPPPDRGLFSALRARVPVEYFSLEAGEEYRAPAGVHSLVFADPLALRQGDAVPRHAFSTWLDREQPLCLVAPCDIAEVLAYAHSVRAAEGPEAIQFFSSSPASRDMCNDLIERHARKHTPGSGKLPLMPLLKYSIRTTQDTVVFTQAQAGTNGPVRTAVEGMEGYDLCGLGATPVGLWVESPERRDFRLSECDLPEDCPRSEIDRVVFYAQDGDARLDPARLYQALKRARKQVVIVGGYHASRQALNSS